MKKQLKIGILLIVLLIIIFVIVYHPMIDCLIKKYLGFSCPACGLSRAFYSIMNLKIKEAIEYNILSLPLFCFITISICSLIYDIFGNKHLTEKIFSYVVKYFYVIVVLLVLSMIINNIKGI